MESAEDVHWEHTYAVDVPKTPEESVIVSDDTVLVGDRTGDEKDVPYTV